MPIRQAARNERRCGEFTANAISPLSASTQRHQFQSAVRVGQCHRRASRLVDGPHATITRKVSASVSMQFPISRQGNGSQLTAREADVSGVRGRFRFSARVKSHDSGMAEADPSETLAPVCIPNDAPKFRRFSRGTDFGRRVESLKGRRALGSRSRSRRAARPSLHKGETGDLLKSGRREPAGGSSSPSESNSGAAGRGLSLQSEHRIGSEKPVGLYRYASSALVHCPLEFPGGSDARRIAEPPRARVPPLRASRFGRSVAPRRGERLGTTGGASRARATADLPDGTDRRERSSGQAVGSDGSAGGGARRS
jgi:hypothetical protein